MATRLAFFATSDEELEWLRPVLQKEVDWCVIDEVQPERRSIVLTGRAAVDFLHSAEPGEIRMFLGRRDLCPEPVWRRRQEGASWMLYNLRQFISSLLIRSVTLSSRGESIFSKPART